MDTFQELLDRARRGEEEAVGVLWRDLHPRLSRYLRSVEPRMAEDLEAETWLQVAQGLHRFQGNEAQLRGWVFTIARHHLASWRRRAARRQTAPHPPESFDGEVAVDDPAQEVLDGLATEAALALVATLPADQAEIVLLRVVGGLDAAEVGRLLGKRPGTIRVLQHRALRKLGSRLPSESVVEGVTR